MTNDQMGFLAILLLIGGVVAGVMSWTIIAWILVIIAVGLIIVAQLRK